MKMTKIRYSKDSQILVLSERTSWSFGFEEFGKNSSLKSTSPIIIVKTLRGDDSKLL